jgi:hypothetical protein
MDEIENEITWIDGSMHAWLWHGRANHCLGLRHLA